ncbi:hypothetical protein BGX24_005472, partial [Mortierella sp. AD032]
MLQPARSLQSRTFNRQEEVVKKLVPGNIDAMRTTLDRDNKEVIRPTKSRRVLEVWQHHRPALAESSSQSKRITIAAEVDNEDATTLLKQQFDEGRDS